MWSLSVDQSSGSEPDKGLRFLSSISHAMVPAALPLGSFGFQWDMPGSIVYKPHVLNACGYLSFHSSLYRKMSTEGPHVKYLVSSLEKLGSGRALSGRKTSGRKLGHWRVWT